MNKPLEDIPAHLRDEYLKFLDNPEKYKKLYPVAYKMLMDIIGEDDEKSKE